MNTKLKVEYKSKILTGILIKEDEKYLTIKLDSGYNANILKSETKIMEKEELELKKNKNNQKQENNLNLPKITILHTGGTIASKVDYKTGAVSSKFTPEELLNMYPQLNQIAQIDAKMIGNLFSEDMRFSHYNLMLEEIKKAQENKSIGVIVSHGTDTLHYTAPALQYAINNLKIPIIIVGAQRSSDRASSDAYSNLNTAVNFIIKNSKKEKSFRRVGICMHENISDNDFLILDSINAKKLHSTRRDAFKQINYLPYAKISNEKIEILREELNTNISNKPLEIIKYNEKLNIGFFKAHPNLNPKEIENLSFYNAVIIEGTGLGHIAVNQVDNDTKIHLKNLEQLEKLSQKIKIIMGTQTVYGQTNLDIYSTGRYIKNYVLGNHMNLTTETLFIRAAYCLSKNKEKFDKIWQQDLEGFEIRSIQIDENEKN